MLQKTEPILVQLDQDGGTDLARQRLIAFMLLQATKDFCIRQVFPLKNESLPDLVIGLVIQVFGGKCRCIEQAVAWIVLANEMPFNKLHQASSFACNACTTFSVFRFARRCP